MNYHPENDMTEDEQAHWEAKAEEAGKGSGASACSRLPYPLRSAEELAGCLISHGLLDESAWHDPEGWDGGIEKDRVFKMLDTIRAEFDSENY